MNDPVPLIRSAEALRALAGAAKPSPCACRLQRCTAWDSVPDGEWPVAHLKRVAKLREPDGDEPTFAEYHPQGTRYESPQAPIALAYFPFNRCDVWQCERCDRHWLRYTEFGGYYVDPRARPLDPALIVEAPPPAP